MAGSIIFDSNLSSCKKLAEKMTRSILIQSLVLLEKFTSRNVFFSKKTLIQILRFHESAGILTVTFLRCEMYQKTDF